MGSPIRLNGVGALGGEELVKLIYDYAILIQKETLESYISHLAKIARCPHRCRAEDCNV
jgi:hypothetical protein